MRRDMDNSQMMTAMDSFNQRAVDVIAGSKMVDALSIEKESKEIKELYGLNNDEGMGNSRFLVARRLVEAGSAPSVLAGAVGIPTATTSNRCAANCQGSTWP